MPILTRNGITVSDRFLEFLKKTKSITTTFFLDVDRDGLATRTCDFLDVEDQKITYLDITKYPDLTQDQAFSDEYRKKRIHISPSRIFGKIFKSGMIERHICSADLEFFSNSIKSYFGPPLKLIVVEGDEIKKYYHHKTYADGNGSLNKSCMRYDETSGYFDLYRDNAKMLVGFDSSNKVAARALLWDHVDMVENDKISNIKLMDRIYTCFDKDIIQLKDWAFSNGYSYKSDQNHHNKNIIFLIKDGFAIEKECHLVLTIPNLFGYKSYPYMDTFSFGYDQTNLLSNTIYTAPSSDLPGYTHYSPYYGFMNTNGWYTQSYEMWEPNSQNSPMFVHRPRMFMNNDYCTYILWLNKKFGYNLMVPPTDDMLKINKQSVDERTERVISQRESTSVESSEMEVLV